MQELDWRSALSILVVDDGADSRTSMKTLLNLHGYPTDVAPSGADALRILEYQWPDVILLDLRMPTMDGYQLAKAIQQKCGSRSKPLLIAVTGLGGDLAALWSRLEGIDHHLLKPIDFPKLDALIDQWRKSSRRGAEAAEPQA